MSSAGCACCFFARCGFAPHRGGSQRWSLRFPPAFFCLKACKGGLSCCCYLLTLLPVCVKISHALSYHFPLFDVHSGSRRCAGRKSFGLKLIAVHCLRDPARRQAQRHVFELASCCLHMDGPLRHHVLHCPEQTTRRPCRTNRSIQLFLGTRN